MSLVWASCDGMGDFGDISWKQRAQYSLTSLILLWVPFTLMEAATMSHLEVCCFPHQIQ